MHGDFKIFLKDLDEKDEPIMSNLSVEDKELFTSYVEITRHFIELNRLFQMFESNLGLLLTCYTINTDDSIVRNNFNGLGEDYILINTLTTNYVSSSKTLTESIETFMKIYLSEQNFDKFKRNVLSKVYDESFSYRFLLLIRNFSQHGHLPVNIYNQKAYFDLDKISSMRHFNISGKKKSEIEKIRENIIAEFGNFPHISFLYTIAEFNLKTIEVYLNFLDLAKDILKFSQDKTKTLLNKKPELIFHNGNSIFNGYVFYDFDGERFHCFNPKDNILKTFADEKNKIKKILIDEKQEIKKIRKKLKR